MSDPSPEPRKRSTKKRPPKKMASKRKSGKPSPEDILLSLQALLTTALATYKVVSEVVKRRRAKRKPPQP